MFPNPVPTRRSDHELVPHTNKAAPLRCMPQASAAWPDQKRRPAWTNQSGSARAKINANWILSVRACSWDSRWAAVFPVVFLSLLCHGRETHRSPDSDDESGMQSGVQTPGCLATSPLISQGGRQGIGHQSYFPGGLLTTVQPVGYHKSIMGGIL